ncbi:TnsA endonuclease N-terminal domain-containing protein [Massilia scottii]|uniref:TnsA endonuclease N-terminal domain-containing protein n=1 Tax=Massilia scottii TaxID=3057166 RepID=UPI002796A14A|nr:TnsA endonuclease N-terminal domain-containing protein [Massilia sp. CCM 9029]MDQ1835289.1 TnsA endonuclease N-terminal domain-containing protein [Massilia sp. CCM 9029]
MKGDQLKRLDSIVPVRTIGLSRRSLTGRVVLDSGGGARFESSLERDWFICLDFDPSVKTIVEQPFSVAYQLEGRTLRYTPDVLVQYCGLGFDEKVIVYEIKPIEELRTSWPKYRRRFTEAVRYCRSQGWRFKIVTENQIRTPLLKNAKFLRKYRGFEEQILFRQQLLYSMRALGRATPQSLLALSYLHEEKRMAALTELWRMVATRELQTNLNVPLTMHSPIWIGEAR